VRQRVVINQIQACDTSTQHHSTQQHNNPHTAMAHRTSTPDITIQRNRLPNLYEVLSRQTKPPVDLFSFYIYMRDAQRSVDYLDFWYTTSPLAA
jgi:hypothetical protein